MEIAVLISTSSRCSFDELLELPHVRLSVRPSVSAMETNPPSLLPSFPPSLFFPLLPICILHVTSAVAKRPDFVFTAFRNENATDCDCDSVDVLKLACFSVSALGGLTD